MHINTTREVANHDFLSPFTFSIEGGLPDGSYFAKNCTLIYSRVCSSSSNDSVSKSAEADLFSLENSESQTLGGGGNFLLVFGSILGSWGVSLLNVTFLLLLLTVCSVGSWAVYESSNKFSL